MTRLADDGDPAPDPGRVPRWVDNHCHLDGEVDAAAVVSEARAAGVAALVTVGTDTARSQACVELASELVGVWATAGVHPHDAVAGTGALVELVDSVLASPGHRLVAVGECGLDYHYDHSPRDVQRRVFAEQIELAHRSGLPLVIHTREAWSDTFSILEEHGMPARTVMHCFTGGPAEAERSVELGAHLSISGIVTFRGAPELREAVAAAPLERLMVETDSPYLAPTPHRGKRNRPAWVARVGEEVAALQGRPVAEVAAVTTANAEAFYGIGPLPMPASDGERS